MKKIEKITRAVIGLLLAAFIFLLFWRLGAELLRQSSEVQATIWASSLSSGDKYLWYGRLQNFKAAIGVATLLLALFGAGYAWHSAQKPE